jgi:hypothetical protein
MKIYRHYKNKDYQLIGSARHSETQEELVLYKCLYENPAGDLWVRPKDLFYGDLDIDGQRVPRFRERVLKVQYIESIRMDDLLKVVELSTNIIPGLEIEKLKQRLLRNEVTNQSVVFAAIDDNIVGFKIGYGLDTKTFYSWLGGVSSAVRRFGVASAMMRMQHDWCRSKGFLKIRTKTLNTYNEMLQLNLKFGFSVVDVEHLDGEAESSNFKLVMDKIL